MLNRLVVAEFFIQGCRETDQDVILGFDWLWGINPQVYCINYGVTLKNGFVADSIPIHCTVKFKLCSFKALMHLLCTS